VSGSDDYGPVRDADETRAHARNMSWSFRAPEEDLLESFDRYGTDKLRVLREDGRTVAGLTLLPLGQWWGGRLLPMGGIALVGTAPEDRGKGTATRIMTAVVREMKESGVPISVLYPAKQTLYRRVGYELAGGRWEISVVAGDVTGGVRHGTVREIRDADRPAVEDAYRRFASRSNGTLDRPDFMWKRLTQPKKERARGFLVEGEGGIEGYVYLYESESAHRFRYDLSVTDFVALTEGGARRLLAFLADHGSLGGEIGWCGDPSDPVLFHLREQRYRQRLFFHWMIRIVDPKAALEGRGYPKGIEGKLHFEIEDEVLPENAGRFTVDVSGGRAVVRTGGAGSIRAHVRGLGAIWTGHVKASSARVAGLVDGDDDALAAADAVFGGSPPWMSDAF
jgi:predicted acetyltransferase